MEKKYKNCQSCGMPLKKSPNGGGTNADGSISDRYCVYCFENGQFTKPLMSVTEMQDLVKAKIKEMGFPISLFANSFAKKIPQLERWKNR